MPSALLQKTPYGSFGGQPGGVLSQTKRDQSPSVMDKEELPLTAEELARSLAERDAIGPPTVGPISIDPTDWLTPGGLAKVGAAFKGVLTGSAASPLLVGAFRSANNTMLAREMLTDIKTLRDTAVKEGERYYNQGYLNPRDRERITTQILSKLSDKEVSKYGTPEFKLDKWLHTTNTIPNQMPQYLEEVTPRQVVGHSVKIRDANAAKAELVKLVDSGTISPDQTTAIKAAFPILDKDILNSSMVPLIEDLLLAQKQGKKLISTPYTSDPYYDIETGAKKLAGAIVKHDIPVEAVEKGSLQQIVSRVNNAEDDAVRVLKKSMEAKNQVIRARTQELVAKQSTDAEDGFVRLESSKDLAQETDILNHCIGAVGRDNDKYIPAFDTVTGEFNQVRGAEHSSFAQYEKALVSGSSEFYSYRPKGLPEVTLEVRNPTLSNGKVIKTIDQAYGKEDRALTPQEGDAVAKFAREMGIGFNRQRFVEEPRLGFPPDHIDVNENGPFWLP